MVQYKIILNSKILIADDEPANVRLLVQMLQQIGFTSINSTTDAREVVGLYQEFQPDLVILDLIMPHLDGVQVIEELKKIEPEELFSAMVITAQPNQTNRLRVLEAGAGDFLGKPYDILELSLRIKNHLKLRNSYIDYLENNRVLKKTIADLTEGLITSKIELAKETAKRNYLENKLKKYNTILKNEFDNEIEELKSLFQSEKIGKK